MKKLFIQRLLLVFAMSVLSFLSACATSKPAIAPVRQVDLPQFMGDWYVIAVMPTVIEKDVFNPLENYQLNADGTINTTFTFNKGSLTGPLKQYNPRGFVRENTQNAVWGMQFIWPIKAEYIIAYLNADYSQTIIARNARDYVWLMARTPTISDADYDKHVAFIKSMGYDLTKLIKPVHK